MTMTSRLLLLLCVVGNIICTGGYETFGTSNPWAVKLNLPQHQGSLPKDINLVALQENPVQNEGDVFAFTARMYNDEPFYFQIWRLINEATKRYQLVAYRKVTPSVFSEQQDVHEDFYMLGDQCVHVLPGDRLGLVFNTAPTPVFYGTYQFSLKADATKLPEIGDQFDFISKLPVKFVATGFVHINSNSPGNKTSVSCPNNITVVRGNVTYTARTTTTYLPPTGVPGMTGHTGLQGHNGSTGRAGMVGDTGEMGFAGATGNQGHIGATGVRGIRNLYTGAVGSVGATGSLGEDGSTGSQGLQGQTGDTGPRGEAGDNYTVTIYGPYRYVDDGNWMSDDKWWESRMLMKVVYIWSAAVTVVLLLTFIIILVVCCQCRAVRRHLKEQ